MVQSKNSSNAVLDALCADQRRRWLQGEQVLVESYQLSYAQLLSDRQSLLLFIAHEVKLRRSLGDEPSLDAFLDRFPHLELDLQELFRGDFTGEHRLEEYEPADAPCDKVDTTPMAETLGYLSTAKADLDSLENTAPPESMSSYSTVVFPTTPSEREPPSDPALPAPPASTNAMSEPAPTTADPHSPQMPAPSPNNPVAFGDYELLERVAHGAMGVVFKARHLRLHRVVAVKMILNSHLGGEEQLRRFYIEAEAAARLEHPGIVAVYDINQHEGRHFIAMQYVQGRSLAEHVKEKIPQRDAVKIVLQVCEAVQFAHDRGVIHRDLKPQNILIGPNGRPVVTDFGLAKQLYEGDSVTVTGQIIGTPSYMSPEQASARTDAVGPHTDVYGLGAVLYCLLTGRPPFAGKSVAEILRDVLDSPPPSMKGARPPVKKELEEICRKCLAKKPSERFPSAGALALRLQQYLDTNPPSARDTGGIRDSRWPRIIHPADVQPAPVGVWAAGLAAARRWVRRTKQSLSKLGGGAARPAAEHWPKLKHGGKNRRGPSAARKRLILAVVCGVLGLTALVLMAYRFWPAFQGG